MKCSQCGKECPEYGAVLLNGDGDFACSQACADAHEREQDHFLNVTIHSDEAMEAWWNQ
jgi:hypothetical protein